VNANLRELDPTVTSMWLRDAPRQRRIHVCLSNSLGFGGSNSCLAFRTPTIPTRSSRAAIDARRPDMNAQRILITGAGVICGSGRSPDEVLEAVLAGRTSIRPIEQWNVSQWPVKIAAEVADYHAAALTGDRKLLKFIRRTDVFGLYAADRAIEQSGFAAWRASLDEAAATRFADATGVFVGSGGGAFAISMTTCR